MGMCFALHSVSDANIKKILESPPLIWRLIAPDAPEVYLDCVNESKQGLFSGLLGKKSIKPDQPVPNLTFVEGENIDADLDKSWQGIHYCFNKTSYKAEPPMDFITLGGQTAGKVEVGYGPARLIDSNIVKAIHERLAKLTVEDLHNNYDPSAMDKLAIYPNIWLREGEEGFDYIAHYFAILQSFIAHCSQHHLGMVVYLC